MKHRVTITIELPSEAHERMLLSIPPRGLPSFKQPTPRGVFIEMVNDGLVRKDALDSVHLTTVGLMVREQIEAEQQEEIQTKKRQRRLAR